MRIFVALSKDEIKDSPPFDETIYRDQAYRGSMETYYQPYVGRETTARR